MKYNYITDYKNKEYTINKGSEQEMLITSRILDFLNKNKYSNVDEFINQNPDIQTFLTNNKMINVIKHFNTYTDTLDDVYYKKIIENIKKIEQEKQILGNEQSVNVQNETKEKSIGFQKVLKLNKHRKE